jgi:hypothetical protein
MKSNIFRQARHVLLGFAVTTAAQASMGAPVEPDVGALCVADQADRDSKNPEWNGRQVDWTKVRPRDAQRRLQMLGLLQTERLKTAADYACAGLIFQHGESAEEARLAFSMFTLAATIDPTTDNVRYLQAAAWDRLMMRLHRPQWYGTQFVRVPGGGWTLGDVDESAVTDADRAKFDVDPIAASRQRLENLNAKKQSATPEASAPVGP